MKYYIEKFIVWVRCEYYYVKFLLTRNERKKAVARHTAKVMLYNYIEKY